MIQPKTKNVSICGIQVHDLQNPSSKHSELVIEKRKQYKYSQFTLLLTLKFLIGKKMTLKTETLANMETKYILCTATSI